MLFFLYAIQICMSRWFILHNIEFGLQETILDLYIQVEIQHYHLLTLRMTALRKDGNLTGGTHHCIVLYLQGTGN